MKLDPLIVATLFSFAMSARAFAEPTPPPLELFENSIRPLLTTHCVECHGAKKQESNLRLDSLAAALRGGDRGAAVVPGQPAASSLLDAVKHVGDLEMPPDAEKLSAESIDALSRWIEQGATWPDGVSLSDGTVELRSGPITEAERSFWSFQPVTDRQPPATVDGEWPANDVDRFVLAALEQAAMHPAPPAARNVLLRRVTFDLTGLPPTPEELEAFLSDDSPDAYDTVVDRLLASRAYGERWGRHWLDVARYADTAGETADYPVREAYRYRDYVVEAFERDKPYDQFLREQVAGELLAAEFATATGDDWNEESLARYEELSAATGFIALSRRFGFDPQNYHHLTIQDTLDTLGQAALGLSIGCARCHDHKFDPINREDYYALYGIFASTRYAFPGSEEAKRPRDFLPAVPPQVAAARQAEFDARVKELTDRIAAQEASRPALEPELAALHAAGPYPVLYGVIDGQPQDAAIQRRGEPTSLGDVAPRRWLEILGGDPLASPESSGRLELADWIASERNPLTARVMVNRVWQGHFGRGLVRTPSDFGVRGERPTHPELLDWLASRFVESGWSVKSIHRLILHSNAYRMACVENDEFRVRDPDNRLRWTFDRRRLSAEEIRDAMLFVAGDLDRTVAGPHPFPPTNAWSYTQHSPFADFYETNRRSVYLMTPRLKRHPYLALFDGPDPNAGTAQRSVSVVPTQALFLMNSSFVHDRSAAFAAKIAVDAADDEARLQEAWRSALGRDIQDSERDRALAFLALYRERSASDGIPEDRRNEVAWSALVRTLLTRNEFLFVE